MIAYSVKSIEFSSAISMKIFVQILGLIKVQFLGPFFQSEFKLWVSSTMINFNVSLNCVSFVQ
jgi:hypothetical protein